MTALFIILINVQYLKTHFSAITECFPISILQTGPETRLNIGKRKKEKEEVKIMSCPAERYGTVPFQPNAQ